MLHLKELKAMVGEMERGKFWTAQVRDGGEQNALAVNLGALSGPMALWVQMSICWTTEDSVLSIWHSQLTFGQSKARGIPRLPLGEKNHIMETQ